MTHFRLEIDSVVLSFVSLLSDKMNDRDYRRYAIYPLTWQNVLFQFDESEFLFLNPIFFLLLLCGKICAKCNLKRQSKLHGGKNCC